MNWAIVLCAQTLAGTLALIFWAQIQPVIAYLLSINAIAFLAYGYDKLAAKSDYPRVPELVLLSLSVLLGVGGAELGRRVFNHKTSKVNFRIKYWLITVVVIVILAAIYLQLEMT